ncbi:MAG: TonB-dependent receptor [Acidobacteriota bacterium]
MRPVLVVSFLLLAFAASPVLPQTSTGTVGGTVRDQSGAVIPSAAVALTNTATNITSKTTTNESGYYLFLGVVPGAYRLAVESAGMQKFEATLTVQVQRSTVVDAVLRVGPTTTEVAVRDVTPMVIVDSPTLGHILERQRIEQLPINGRNVSSLLVSVPGMEGMRAYGLREGSQEFVLDGAAQTDKLWGGMMSRQPGLDTIEEFKVEVNNSSAKFTRPTSVIMSTRSGTNRVHGSAFETHRNNAIGKARQRTDFYSKPPQLIRNEFGVSAGGPVRLPRIYDGRNRTFFFAAYEGYRNINPRTGSGRVFSEAMRNGDFRELVDSQGRQTKIHDPWSTNPNTWERQQFAYRGVPNTIDPARLSPLAKHLLSVTPLPTHPQINPMLDDNWYGPLENTARNWTWAMRFDHRFSDKDAFYARLSNADHYSNVAMSGQIPTLDKIANYTQTKAPNKSLALTWVRTLSPTLFNEVLASAQRERWREATGEPGAFYSDKLGLPNPFGSDGWPGMYSTGLGSLIYESTNTKASDFNYFIFDDNATKIHRRHELMFGFHYRYDQLTVLPDQQNVAGNLSFGSAATSLYDATSPRQYPQATPFTGSNIANLYIGVLNYTNQFARGNFYMRGREYALYFQDNWKVSPRLTLNLGLRWEKWPPYTEKHHILTGFDPARHMVVLASPLEEMYAQGATLPKLVEGLQAIDVKFESYKEAGLNRDLMTTPWTDFGPRLGFAYRAGDGARGFILRGGFRTSYFPIPLRTFTARMRLNAPLTAWYTNDRNTGTRLSPDGIALWGMRSAPTVIAGVNSRNEVSANDRAGLGRGWAIQASYFAKDQPDPRVHDWNLTLEKEVLPNTVARAAYVGNHGGHLEQFYRYNEQTPEYIWYATRKTQLPTGEFGDVLRRPYDQVVYGTVEEYRKSGWSNFQGFQLEMERRYSKGFGYQVFYTMSNALGAGGLTWNNPIPGTNVFLPGAVPADPDARNRFLNYQRDTAIPKHRVRWNWIADLPFGRGQWLGGSAKGILDKVIGGWQIAGMGYLRSTYFSLPTSVYPVGNGIETYGYQYPVQDCRPGVCRPGYLWWNGYIPANQINSVDANGRPNGVMGVPAAYKPAAEPLIPWPKNPSRGDPMYQFYGSNTVWAPLNDGTLRRTTYNDNLHPWRQQYLPSVRQWNLDASLFKTVPITERFRLRFNADFFNVLNHPGNPNSVGGDGILSTRSSGSGARELQLTLRLSW